ncbi:MAG: hypothetical protein HUU20_02630 [Pirellulales bacterium]|nr:hypothetical protein [Pirellulales bacterium]
MLPFLSLVYLALPYLIFAYGWLWRPYAAVVWLAVIAALALTGRTLLGRGGPEKPAPGDPSWIHPVLVTAATVGLAYLSGVGGLGYQQPGDWVKHNAILHDLSTMDWPVRYTDTAGVPQGRYLTYYIAYYLPAAVVGRLCGLIPAHLALFAWTLCGLLLVAAWLGRLLRSRVWMLWAAWFALSGMDAAGVALRGGGDWTFLEWWASLGQYSSNTSLLVWVPQHALPGWIATALVVDRAEREADLSLAGFAAALTGLWSPFVTIGLAPVVLLVLFRARWRTVFGFANLVAAPVVLFMSAAYLASVDRGQVPNQWNITWYESQWFAKAWPVFCLLEFGFYAMLIYPNLRSDRDGRLPGTSWNRSWFWMAIAVLTLLPLYRIGILNDLVMRASIPALFVFWVVLLRVISSPAFRWETWYSSLLLFCLLIGAIQPSYQLGVQVVGTPRHLEFAGSTPNLSIAHVQGKFLPQYLGRPSSFFFGHLAP